MTELLTGTKTKTEALKKDLKDIIELHERMRYAYFYSPPCTSRGRREYEKCFSMNTEFTHKGQDIFVSQETNCSCNHVYYKMHIMIDGEWTIKDIRFIKRILRELEAEEPKSEEPMLNEKVQK